MSLRIPSALRLCAIGNRGYSPHGLVKSYHDLDCDTGRYLLTNPKEC
jgi:hypothetical protein